MRLNPNLILSQALFAALLLAGLLFIPGCSTNVVTVTKAADGSLTVKGESYNLGFDRSIDELTVPTSLGAASLKGASSSSKLTEAAADMAATARQLSTGRVKP